MFFLSLMGGGLSQNRMALIGLLMIPLGFLSQGSVEMRRTKTETIVIGSLLVQRGQMEEIQKMFLVVSRVEQNELYFVVLDQKAHEMGENVPNGQRVQVFGTVDMNEKGEKWMLVRDYFYLFEPDVKTIRSPEC